MSFNTEKADQTIQEWLQALFDKLNRVNQIHVVWYVLGVGVTIAIATTGFLGKDSIDPLSLEGFLFALNFLSMMLFAASKFNPTVKYLGKLFAAGLIGYSAFWQFAAMADATEFFKPIFPNDSTFAIVLFCIGVISALIYAFSGHQEYVDPSSMGITQYELEEMREALKVYQSLPEDIKQQYAGY